MHGSKWQPSLPFFGKEMQYCFLFLFITIQLHIYLLRRPAFVVHFLGSALHKTCYSQWTNQSWKNTEHAIYIILLTSTVLMVKVFVLNNRTCLDQEYNTSYFLKRERNYCSLCILFYLLMWLFLLTLLIQSP